MNVRFSLRFKIYLVHILFTKINVIAKIVGGMAVMGTKKLQ